MRKSQPCVLRLTVNVRSGSKLTRSLFVLRENFLDISLVMLVFILSTALILYLDFIRSSLSENDGLIIVPRTNVLN